jgi:putative sterol carrier protein
MDDQIEQGLEQLRSAFLPEKTVGLSAIIQVEVDDLGVYTLRIAGQTIEILHGESSDAQLIMRASRSDFFLLLEKKLDPTQAFFQGRLYLRGDMGLAVRLPEYFKLS